jgi:hypothetical protein
MHTAWLWHTSKTVFDLVGIAVSAHSSCSNQKAGPMQPPSCIMQKASKIAPHLRPTALGPQGGRQPELPVPVVVHQVVHQGAGAREDGGEVAEHGDGHLWSPQEQCSRVSHASYLITLAGSDTPPAMAVTETTSGWQRLSKLSSIVKVMQV